MDFRWILPMDFRWIFLWISGFFLGNHGQRKVGMIWDCHDVNLASVGLKWVIMDGKVNGTKRFTAEPLKFWVPYFQTKSWNQVQHWWFFHVIPFASQHLLGKNRWVSDFGSRTPPYPKKLKGDGSWWWQLAPWQQFAVPCRCSLNACFLWHGQGSLVSSPWAKKGGGKWGKGKEVFHGVSESCGAHGTSQSDFTRILITHTNPKTCSTQWSVWGLFRRKNEPDPWKRAKDLAALRYELFDICIDQKDEFEAQNPSKFYGIFYVASFGIQGIGLDRFVPQDLIVRYPWYLMSNSESQREICG